MSLIIGFFKVILIFLGLFVVVSLIGYIYNQVFGKGKFKAVGVLIEIGLGAALFPLSSNKLIAIGLVVIYAIASMAFFMQYKDLGKEFRCLPKIKEDLNLGWYCIYGYFVPMIFLMIPELQELIPVEIKGFPRYLVALVLTCAFMPIFQIDTVKKKINRVYEQIDKYKFISQYEIKKIAMELAGDNPSNEDINKKNDEVMEIVKHFEETEKLIAVDVEDSDSALYLERKYYDDIARLLDNEYKGADIISSDKIFEKLKSNLKLNYDLLQGLIYALFMEEKGYKLYEKYFVSQKAIEKIIYALDHEFSIGRKSEKQIANDFHISVEALTELIEEQGYIVKFHTDVSKEWESERNMIALTDDASVIDPASIIDINRCSQGDFLEIPSVNIIIAKKLIDYRESKGGFSSIDEFVQMAQIKPHMIEKIRGMVTCGTYVIPEHKAGTLESKRKVRLRGRVVEY